MSAHMSSPSQTCIRHYEKCNQPIAGRRRSPRSRGGVEGVATPLRLLYIDDVDADNVINDAFYHHQSSPMNKRQKNRRRKYHKRMKSTFCPNAPFTTVFYWLLSSSLFFCTSISFPGHNFQVFSEKNCQNSSLDHFLQILVFPGHNFQVFSESNCQNSSLDQIFPKFFFFCIKISIFGFPVQNFQVFSEKNGRNSSFLPKIWKSLTWKPKFR